MCLLDISWLPGVSSLHYAVHLWKYRCIPVHFFICLFCILHQCYHISERIYDICPLGIGLFHWALFWWNIEYIFSNLLMNFFNKVPRCMGSKWAVYDVAECRKCAEDFETLVVLRLMILCMYFAISSAPDNLNQGCSEQLANLDKTALLSFAGHSNLGWMSQGHVAHFCRPWSREGTGYARNAQAYDTANLLWKDDRKKAAPILTIETLFEI